jgi:hypothetical protein
MFLSICAIVESLLILIGTVLMVVISMCECGKREEEKG